MPMFCYGGVPCP